MHRRIPIELSNQIDSVLFAKAHVGPLQTGIVEKTASFLKAGVQPQVKNQIDLTY